MLAKESPVVPAMILDPLYYISNVKANNCDHSLQHTIMLAWRENILTETSKYFSSLERFFFQM